MYELSLFTSVATGNTSVNSYIIIAVIAGVLVIGAVVAGIFTKKKK
ncbi:MAG: hypothetical protein IKP75_01955 [Oscillospiraceae bacterium]|jgi:hypothetical protein|nr:hypothetical protein [Oscillospiraceae bacterium]MBR4345689.1 hypothetical protein [Oscillospiraceae bacterium]